MGEVSNGFAHFAVTLQKELMENNGHDLMRGVGGRGLRSGRALWAATPIV